MAESNPKHLVNCAKWYAKEKGWPVLPLHTIWQGVCTCYKKDKCPQPGKHPRYDEDLFPNGAKSASTDQYLISEWWRKWKFANVGIATGSLSFDVLDVDMHGNINGMDTLLDLEEKYGKIPDTVEQVTGGGGYQKLFRWTAGRLHNKAAFAAGLDIRTDGGLIVAPPSLHKSGNLYEWEVSSSPKVATLAEMPEWIILLVEQSRAASNANGNGGGMNLEAILGGVSEGQRDDTIFQYACRLRAKNIDYQEARLLVTGVASKCSPVFPEKDAVKKLDQAWKYSAGVRDCFHDDPYNTRPQTTDSPDSLNSLSSPDSLGSQRSLSFTSDSPEIHQDFHQGSPDSPDVPGTKINNQEQVPENQSQIVKNWVDMCDGVFTIKDLAHELQIRNTKSYDILKRVLANLVKDNLLERVGKTRGVYQKVESSLEEMDIFSEDEESDEFPVVLPMDLTKLVKIYPKNIVVVAGEKNSAKTAFALETARLNMNKIQDVCYFSSEMGRMELRERLKCFENVRFPDWKKVHFYDVSRNFHHHIRPNGLNIIDFLEIHDDFWKIGEPIRQIYDKLNEGVAVICIQKKKGVDFARGGEGSAEKARLYVSLSMLYDAHGKPYNQIKIVYGKKPRSIDDYPYGVDGMVRDFNIFGGWLFNPKNEWGQQVTTNNQVKKQIRY